MKENNIEKTRQLTAAELKYLKRYNWLRAMKLFNFKLPIVLLIICSSVLIYLFFFALSDALVNAQNSPLMDQSLRYAFPSLIILAGTFFIWHYKSAKITWWLSTKNLEAVELTGTLHIQDGIGNTVQWFINGIGIILPEPWEKYIFERNMSSVKMWCVKRPDATGKVPKYTFQGLAARNLGSPYNIFQDHQYFVLSCNSLNITNEVENKLPSVRADYTWRFSGVIGLVITIFVYIALSIPYEEYTEDIERLKRKLTWEEKQLNVGTPIELSTLEHRDLPTLYADEEYNSILVSDQVFKYIVRSFTTKDRAFLLTQAELKIIQRLSTVMPEMKLKMAKKSIANLREHNKNLHHLLKNSQGMSPKLITENLNKQVEELLSDKSQTFEKASSADLIKYRQAINKRINETLGVSNELKQHFSDILLAMSDSTLELQMGQYSLMRRPSHEFVKAFIKPIIYLPTELKGYLKTANFINCADYVLCTHSEYNKPVMMDGFLLINSHNNALNGELKIVSRSEFESFKALKKELDNISYISPSYYWTLGNGGFATALFIIMIGLVLSSLQASSCIRRFYSQAK